MLRSIWLGLAGLLLVMVPFSRAMAQAEPVAEGQEQTPAGGDPPAVAPGDREMDVEVPSSAMPTAGSARQVQEVVLDVQGSNFLVLDDLAPDALIVLNGQPLAIEEAVALSIKNGLNVEVERFGPLIAEAAADAAWGDYDPLLSADARYDVIKSPNFNVFNPPGGRDPSAETNRDRVSGGGVGVSQLVPYVGASVDLRLDSSSTATRSTLSPLDDRYDTGLFLSASVPLLRNLIWNSSWTNVKLAAYQGEAAEQQFRQALMDSVRSTINLYWGLVAARDQVRVAQKSLETARALLDQTRTQYEVGVVSQVEVVEAEAGVAEREFELIRTANLYRNAQDQLIDAVLGRELVARSDLQITPTADLSSYELLPINVEQSVDKAFQNRPELHLLENAIQQDEVDLTFAKNQRLPQFDAEFQFGYVGASGAFNENVNTFGQPLPVPLPADTYWDDSFNNFLASDGADNYRVQGVFSIPIPNTAGRKNVSRREFELRQTKSRRVRLEQNIILEVRAASRTLLSAAQGIEAAERRRLAAEEQLRAERIRLEYGESTPFEVLQREDDLVDAESQKIFALQTFRTAETALQRAEGTILEAHSIQVDAIRESAR